jgi:putative tryptophan/tyrosine transport system substrate-binding protein
MVRVVSRRALLIALGAAPLTATARGQQRRAPVRVGFVSWFNPWQSGQIEPLREGLRELGWIEGRNLDIEVHFTQGSGDRTRQALQSLIERKFDVIVVRATNVAHLAKEATRTIPIVMLVADPLATGLVHSLARPEANITGLSLQGPDLAGKRLEYLRALMPNVRTVAFLGAADDPNAATFVRATEAAAIQFGVALRVHLVPNVQAFTEKDFTHLASQGVQALLVQQIFTGHQDRIVTFAMRHRIAVISSYPAFAQAGGLLTFGPDDAAVTRRASYFVDRLLKGASPSDLPVEQPSRFTLALNMTTAKALGLSVPASLSTLADFVYQ